MQATQIEMPAVNEFPRVRTSALPTPGPGQVLVRVAALTKVGGWADHVVLDEVDLVDVPDGVSAEAAETVVVNGLTAYRMLFRVAKVSRGQTIVVLGASGGVGTTL